MTWSAAAEALSIRNCTCMSTQPSLRLRPATFGTSRILVRYIFAGFLAAPARLIFRLLFCMARFTIRIPQLDHIPLVLTHFVIAGLDPAIHPLRKKFLRRMMDPRV